MYLLQINCSFSQNWLFLFLCGCETEIIAKISKKTEDGDVYAVQCFLFYSVLLAVNRPEIDFAPYQLE